MIQALLLDISGVLHLDQKPIAGAVEAVARLRRMGLPLRFLTNSSRQNRRQLWQQLQTTGFEISEAEILTAPQAIRHHLHAHGLSPFLLVHPELAVEFSGLAGNDPNCVVVCDAGDAFTYAALDTAFQLLMAGAPLLAVGDNRYFRAGGKLHLDAGPFIQLLAHAARVEPLYFGKPAARFFHSACAELGVAPEVTLMVGDDVTADVIGALDAGLLAALVKTGKYRSGDENALEGRSAWLAEDLPALFDQCFTDPRRASPRSPPG